MRPLASASVIIGFASGYPDDARAELAEALLDVLVAAIEMVDAVDHRLPLGHEPRDYQARRGAQVGGHDVRAREAVHAADDRGVALDVDGGTQAAQLLHVHEPVLEDRLRDQRGA